MSQDRGFGSNDVPAPGNPSFVYLGVPLSSHQLGGTQHTVGRNNWSNLRFLTSTIFTDFQEDNDLVSFDSTVCEHTGGKLLGFENIYVSQPRKHIKRNSPLPGTK